MNRRQPSSARLNALKGALRRAKLDEEITLDTMMAIWGCNKPQMTKIRDSIVDFPAHKVGPKGVMLYPARAALKALIAEETRGDREQAELARRQARIMGRSVKGKSTKREVHIPVGELAQMSRLSAEIEEREREQGAYAPTAAVAAVAANVFGILSSALSNLELTLDPNGMWPQPDRDRAHTAGRDLLLKIHREMKDMLAGHVPSRKPDPAKSRKPAGRAQRAQARRKA